MSPELRSLYFLLIAFEAIGALGVIQADSDFTWLGLALTAGFVWVMIERLKVPDWIAGLALVLLVLDAASALLLLYSRIQPWDRIMHTLGGGTIAAGALHMALRALNKGQANVRRPDLFIIASVSLMVITIGFIYEFLEYLVDKLYFRFPKTLVSAYNMMEDQLFNLLGGAIILAGYYLWERAKSKTFGPKVAHAEENKPA